MRSHLDWLGLSIDAPDDETHAEMGRGLRGEIASGHSKHLQRSMAVWGIARELGYGLKLNTMVDSRNSRSDMSSLVRSLAPDRWKVFQFLHIEGENDRASGYGITAEEFRAYVNRHRMRLSGTGIGVISEENDEMLGSYAMIDPTGRAYTNLSGSYRYSSRPIHEIGFKESGGGRGALTPTYSTLGEGTGDGAMAGPDFVYQCCEILDPLPSMPVKSMLTRGP